MEKYFNLISSELLNKLEQIRQFITRHNPTIGVLTEAVLREFLAKYLPKSVAVEEGFIINESGQVSKQCDILVYDHLNFAPYYRINDIVVIPAEAVVAVIEVKTTLNKKIFSGIVEYFANIQFICKTKAKTYLFIYNSPKPANLERLFHSYRHPGEYQQFDHDTFQLLPDEISGLDNAYHFKKSFNAYHGDMMGYDSWFYKDKQGSQISAMQIFFNSIYNTVQHHNGGKWKLEAHNQSSGLNTLESISAIDLFSA
jgi:hypothetical protein